jgi:hypothetical protein
MTSLLASAGDLRWLREAYPFVDDGQPIVCAIESHQWIAVYAKNHYRHRPRVWCLQGHACEPVQLVGGSWGPPPECPKCEQGREEAGHG